MDRNGPRVTTRGLVNLYPAVKAVPRAKLMKKSVTDFLRDPISPPMGVTYLVERGTRPGLNAALAWSAGALIILAEVRDAWVGPTVGRSSERVVVSGIVYTG